MLEGKRLNFVDNVCINLHEFKNGYFLTLNALTKDEILFESQIKKMMNWLNVHCFRRSFLRGTKRLKILGVFEIGTENLGLHIHLLIMHNNDTNRTINEIESFIRKKYYRLLRARGRFDGNLIDLQHVRDLRSRVEYMSKNFYKVDDFNFVCF